MKNNVRLTLICNEDVNDDSEKDFDKLNDLRKFIDENIGPFTLVIRSNSEEFHLPSKIYWQVNNYKHPNLKQLVDLLG